MVSGGGSSKGRFQECSLNITSLVDAVTILLFFLIKNYSVSTAGGVVLSESITLPSSQSQLFPESALNITITKREIVLDGKKIVEVKEGAIAKENKDGAYKIIPLYEALKKHAEKSKFIEKNSNKSEFDSKILLQADREIPYALIRDVMATAGMSEYNKFRFLVRKDEE